MADENLTLQLAFQANTEKVNAVFAKISSLADKMDKDVKRTDGSLKKASNSADSFGNKLLKAATYAAGFYLVKRAVESLADSFLSTAEGIDKITDKSKGLGVSAQQLSALGKIGKQSGVEIDALGMALKTMNAQIGALNQGEESAKSVFKTLGLTSKDFANNKGGFDEVIQGLAGVTDKYVQAKVAQELFGRGATGVLTLIRNGSIGVGKALVDMKLELTDSQRAAVDAFGDTKDQLGFVWQSFKEKTVAAIAPAFTRILEYVQQTIDNFGGIDKAAESFGDAIVNAVRVAINAIDGLLGSMETVKRSFLFLQDLELQRQSRVNSFKLADEAGRQARFGDGDNGWGNKTNSFIPGIGAALTQSSINRQLGANAASTNASLKSDADRKNFINNFQEVISGSKSEINSIYPILEQTSDQLRKSSENLDNASKSLTSIEGFIKSQGQSELQRILGDKVKESGKPKIDEEFDKAVRNIFTSATTGSRFRGQGDLYNYGGQNATELFNDLNKQTQEGLARSGADASTVAARYGVLQQLKEYIDKIDPKTQKVALDIKVEGSEDFLIKVAKSQEKVTIAQVQKVAAAAAKMGAK